MKPCYGDNIQSSSQSVVQCNSFDPRRTYHRQLDPMSVDKLLTQIKRTVPNTGLQQFWRDNPNFENKIVAQAEELAPLKNHIFHMIWLPELFPVSAYQSTIKQSVIGHFPTNQCC